MSEQIHEMENLFRAYHQMHRSCMKCEFEKRGLGELSNPKLLFILRYEAEDMTLSQKEIADYAGIAPPTVAISLKRMEKSGLVRKVADENDMRRNKITLTEKGRILTEECQKEIIKIHKCVFKGFSDSELNLLCGFYRRMIHNLKALGVKPPRE